MFKKKSAFIIMLVVFFALGFVAQNVIGAGLSKIPLDLDKVPEADRDNQILRLGIIAELDAINLYEQMAAYAINPHIKEVLLDIAQEEKTHIGEFQALLSELDEGYRKELERGKEEVKEMLGKD